jgi:predicted DNA-binding ribbon-helix-helix protein
MSTLSLRLPNSLHRFIKEVAKEEGVSINQLLTNAAAEKVSVLRTVQYLEKRAGRGDQEAFHRVLAKVKARGRAPLPGDALP